MSNEWIKMTDRKPTESDLPVILGAYPVGHWVQLYCTTLICLDTWTHWAPQLKVPPPPAKEPTQDEQDASAYRSWLDKNHYASAAEVWRGAQNYERSEIRHLIKRYQNSEIPASELIRLISARVKP